MIFGRGFIHALRRVAKISVRWRSPLSPDRVIVPALPSPDLPENGGFNAEGDRT